MAALSGRLLRLKKGVTVVAGAKSDNITINNEPIDITDKDDSGWRTYLSEVGVRSVDADVSGVLLDSTLLSIAVGTGSSLVESWKLDIDAIGDFDGDFFLSNVTVTGEQEEGVTFTANIQSAGAITFT